MVHALIAEEVLKTREVIDAMRKVPRELFVSLHMREYAYNDTPLPTEYGQTISAPHG
jgi:protein-L-isoaspartate(D-aspartate) O-methyltransferase